VAGYAADVPIELDGNDPTRPTVSVPIWFVVLLIFAGSLVTVALADLWPPLALPPLVLFAAWALRKAWRGGY
jgi:hypothetical protein